ncbi:Ig domain-containing protein [Actinacidiphila acididurans]|uniref:Ig domain-containing protein n=1 Tax=Actinacidiphila acididurans TaxID=2784346 RepID=A0ABS2U2S5_9ACTN|nr:Ig domain-containing protein [Actinacidiphila acididurans]MBM9509667.1 putative Ig domain-containing protein [Actinacidiphila acididurans]
MLRAGGRAAGRTAAAAVAVFVAVLALCVPASAAPSSGGAAGRASASASASASAGSGIGDAGELTGSVTGAIVAGSNDWWVIYPAVTGGAVAVTVQNTSAADTPCRGIHAALYNADGTRGSALGSSDIAAGNAAQVAGRQAGADRYFVNVTAWGCTSVAPYGLTPTGGGGAGTQPVTGHILAGSSIGAAWPPLLGHTSYAGTLGGNGSEDWYVLYKKADTSQATIRVQNTTANDTIPCAGVSITLWGSTGTRNGIQSAQMAANGSVTFALPGTEPGDAQGRYFVELVPWGCVTGGQTYTLEPEPAAEWAAPAAVPSATLRSGSSIGTAWPPLHGGTAYRESVNGSGTEDWYVLAKKQDAALATLRVQNTTVDGSAACGGITATVFGSGGTQDQIQSQQIGSNGTTTFTFPGTEASDARGLYYVEVTPWGCTGGGQTYTMEPEPAAEWAAPAQVPAARATPGTAAADAWPPLPGGVSSYQTLGNTTGQDWYVLYKKADSSLATVRVQDTSVDGSVRCTGLTVTLWGATGTQAVRSVQMSGNGTATFVLPGRETGSTQGRYYVEIAPWGCTDLGQTYAVEPEPAAEFGTAAQSLPIGPSRTAAAGPLSGSVNYTARLASSTTQDWAYFHANGSGSLRVQNTTPSTDTCKSVRITLYGPGSTTATTTPSSGAVSALAVRGAGDYFVELTTGGCAPATAMSALLDVSASLRGPALSVSTPTLPGGTLHKKYAATVKVSGGHAPYTFTAKTTLPAGLTLNRTTGSVTGTPTKSGSYTFMVAVTDATKPTHNTVTVQIALKVS